MKKRIKQKRKRDNTFLYLKLILDQDFIEDSDQEMSVDHWPILFFFSVILRGKALLQSVLNCKQSRRP